MLITLLDVAKYVFCFVRTIGKEVEKMFGTQLREMLGVSGRDRVWERCWPSLNKTYLVLESLAGADSLQKRYTRKSSSIYSE